MAHDTLWSTHSFKDDFLIFKFSSKLKQITICVIINVKEKLLTKIQLYAHTSSLSRLVGV